MCIPNVFHESNISCINVSSHTKTEQSSLCFYVDQFAAATAAAATASLHAKKARQITK